jgi:hypothetical protein
VRFVPFCGIKESRTPIARVEEIAEWVPFGGGADLRAGAIDEAV